MVLTTERAEHLNVVGILDHNTLVFRSHLEVIKCDNSLKNSYELLPFANLVCAIGGPYLFPLS